MNSAESFSKEKKNSSLETFPSQRKASKEQQIMKDTTIQIRISTIEKKNIEEYAKQKGESVTNYILTAVRERIELSDKLDLILKKIEDIENK